MKRAAPNELLRAIIHTANADEPIVVPNLIGPTSSNLRFKVKQVKIGRMENSYRTFLSSGLFVALRGAQGLS